MNNPNRRTVTATQWVDDLPLGKRGPGRPVDPQLLKLAADLKEYPGRWAILPHNGDSRQAASSAARRVKEAKGAFIGGGYEAVVRVGVVYARYVGTTAARRTAARTARRAA